MSRKTTSGEESSRAASTSAPLRHSPATTNSGNAARSWRTPRRAAGSSSAIKAFHLACFTVWLRTHLAIRQSQSRDCTAFRTWNDLERRSFTVKRTQTLACVLDAVTRRRRYCRIDTHAVVDDCDLQHVTRAIGSDKQKTRVRIFCDAVPDRVLNEMLQRKTRNRRIHQRLRNSELGSQAIREARTFDGHILAD